METMTVEKASRRRLGVVFWERVSQRFTFKQYSRRLEDKCYFSSTSLPWSLGVRMLCCTVMLMQSLGIPMQKHMKISIFCLESSDIRLLGNCLFICVHGDHSVHYAIVGPSHWWTSLGRTTTPMPSGYISASGRIHWTFVLRYMRGKTETLRKRKA